MVQSTPLRCCSGTSGTLEERGMTREEGKRALQERRGRGHYKGGGEEGVTREEGKRGLQGRRGRGHYKGGGIQGITREEGYRALQGRRDTGHYKGGGIQGITREEGYRALQGHSVSSDEGPLNLLPTPPLTSACVVVSHPGPRPQQRSPPGE